MISPLLSFFLNHTRRFGRFTNSRWLLVSQLLWSGVIFIILSEFVSIIYQHVSLSDIYLIFGYLMVIPKFHYDLGPKIHGENTYFNWLLQPGIIVSLLFFWCERVQITEITGKTPLTNRSKPGMVIPQLCLMCYWGQSGFTPWGYHSCTAWSTNMVGAHQTYAGLGSKQRFGCQGVFRLLTSCLSTTFLHPPGV